MRDNTEEDTKLEIINPAIIKVSYPTQAIATPLLAVISRRFNSWIFHARTT